ncbi:MAG: DUF3575 domain-containing protein [Bacteroidetes bacterium]|nr:DUF3575 domain-containing protein [Bacteroidota bacterium]
MNKNFIIILFAFGILLFPKKSFSQVSGVKINAPLLLVGVLNAEIETAISPSFSFNTAIHCYPFKKVIFTDKEMTGFTIQPGLRYWIRGLYSGCFIGAYFTGGMGAFTSSRHYFNVLGLGAGASFGYAWMISPRFNLEFEVGGSLAYVRYDATPLDENRTDARYGRSKIAPIPSKLGVNLVYLF